MRYLTRPLLKAELLSPLSMCVACSKRDKPLVMAVSPMLKPAIACVQCINEGRLNPVTSTKATE